MRILWLRLLILLAFGVAAAQAEENWPEFRGPDRNGHSAAKNLPLVWSETNNVVWKTAVHDLGWSSPVVWGKQIWLTTATEDGKQLFALCLSSQTGDIVHNIKVFETQAPEHVASVNAALCQGCGACVTACPNGASQQKAFETEQIFAMIDYALA